ncbi:MAG: hypothetical protein KAH86_00940 [Methanosarcinales archaeon]|nr:hypothetical protein [Methanosarcinales archaeon]
MRVYIITILILATIISGCAALDKTPVLYITLNITDNESGISLTDGIIDMEPTSKLKVIRQDQTVALPHISILGYANSDIITYRASKEYAGENTYTFTAPLIEDKVPKYNDSMLFEIRIFNKTSMIGREYFAARWRWNETE